jgi:nucleoside 2-deoxyribosyltransferase
METLAIGPGRAPSEPRRLYFAAPLFSEAERRFNAELAARIEAAGFRVFMPQRDAAEARAIEDPASRQRAIFELDRDQSLRADVVLAVFDGRVPDEGVCFELGVAYAQRLLTGTPKLLVGLLTDSRTAFADSRLNLMLEEALDHLVDSEEELLELLVAVVTG